MTDYPCHWMETPADSNQICLATQRDKPPKINMDLRESDEGGESNVE